MQGPILALIALALASLMLARVAPVLVPAAIYLMR
jgi:hypothetical protein